jgi:hypothetical protein
LRPFVAPLRLLDAFRIAALCLRVEPDFVLCFLEEAPSLLCRLMFFPAAEAPLRPALDSFLCVEPLVLAGPVRRAVFEDLLDDRLDFLLEDLDFDLSPPPVYLFTVAQPILAACFSPPPRLRTPFSICSAMRFCLSV